MSKQYLVGIDIGGTNVDALLVNQTFDNEFEQIAFHTKPIRSAEGKKPIDTIIEVVDELLEKGSVADSAELLAIGVGVPGLVNPATGHVALAVNLDEESMMLGPLLEARFGCPVLVENDANAVALGAAKFLVDPSIKHLAFVTLGTGVGSGLILNGKVFHGSQNMAGEIGHMFIKENDVRCSCGANGCLETFVAGPAIKRMAEKVCASDQETTLRNYADLSAAAVFIEADKNDPVSIEIVNEVAVTLARALQGLIMSFDMQKIVIGGGISRAGNTLLLPILNEWKRMRDDSVMATEMLQPKKLMICPATYKAGAWGAVAVALGQQDLAPAKLVMQMN